MTQSCHYCSSPAEYLCDCPLAPTEDAVLVPARITGEKIATCSRPICAEHRVVRGRGIATFRLRQGGRRCESFSIDYCPDCASAHNLKEQPVQPNGFPPQQPPADPWAGYNEHADLDQFGTDYRPEHLIRPRTDSLANGDYDFEIADASLDRIEGHKVARLGLRLQGRTVEHVYWLNREQGVRSFGAEMAALGFDSRNWGEGPGKLKLSVAIPACVAKLPGIKFRATKTSRQDAKAQPPKTYHELLIHGRISGQQPPTRVQVIPTGVTPAAQAAMATAQQPALEAAGKEEDLPF